MTTRTSGGGTPGRRVAGPVVTAVATLVAVGWTGAAALAAVPVQPGREEARGWATRELARREYAEARPGLIQRVLQWLLNQLTELRFPLGPGPAIGVTLILVVVVVLVTVALARYGRLLAHRHPTGSPDVLGANTLTAAEHRAVAEEHARAGRWAPAVLARFRALARELEEHGILTPAPGRTANEIARNAARTLPDLGGDLRDAAHLFDEVCYGRHPIGAQGYGLVAALDDAVRGTRRLPGADVPEAVIR